MNITSLKDRVAIVTGGGQGMGKSIAIEFATQGCNVVIVDVNIDNASAVANEACSKSVTALPIQCDVSKKVEVDNMVNNVKSKFGRLDILVNNAGITKDSLLEKMTEEDWNKVIDVNLKGPFLCSQAAALVMRENKYGRVINFSSKGGCAGNVGQTNYSASKLGVIGLTRSLAKEFGRYAQREGADMTCNAIMPGYIETPMTETIPEKLRVVFKGMIPLGRSAQPDEIAKVVSFLASPEAGYVTGVALGVDGGFFMGVQC